MKILVVVDVQNDFITGALKNDEALSKVPAIVEEIKNFDGDAIFATLDTHDEDYMKTKEGQRLPVPHCIEYTDGWRIEPTVQKALRDKSVEILDRKFESQFYRETRDENDGSGLYVVEKHTFGYDNWSDLLNDTLDIDNLYLDTDELEITVVGFDTEYCVISNVFGLKAAFPNARIIVKKSCIAGADAVAAQKALDVMATCHIDII